MRWIATCSFTRSLLFSDELGYLHPFRGGNAMVLRIFGSRLAHDAGWDLDSGSVTREEYRSAKHSAYRGDTSALETMFDAILRPANPTRALDRRLESGACTLIAGDCIGLWLIPTP